jgi:hypothetical protein
VTLLRDKDIVDDSKKTKNVRKSGLKQKTIKTTSSRRKSDAARPECD